LFPEGIQSPCGDFCFSKKKAVSSPAAIRENSSFRNPFMNLSGIFSLRETPEVGESFYIYIIAEAGIKSNSTH
jgi:hypothetical protein